MVRKEGFLRSYGGNSSFIGFKEDQIGLERRSERRACNSKDRCRRLHCLDSSTGAGGFGRAEQYGEHVNLFCGLCNGWVPPPRVSGFWVLKALWSYESPYQNFH